MIKYILSALLFFPSFAFANDQAKNIEAMGKLFISVGFMIGLFLFISGLYSVYLMGKHGNDPSRSFGAAFSKLSAGTILLLSVTMYSIVKGTVGPSWSMTNDSLALSSTALDGLNKVGFLEYLPNETLITLFSMIWLIGLFGFLKGIYLIRFTSEQANGQQGSPITKVLTHMIGGVVLMNIRDASNLVGGFFGWDWLMMG